MLQSSWAEISAQVITQSRSAWKKQETTSSISNSPAKNSELVSGETNQYTVQQGRQFSQRTLAGITTSMALTNFPRWAVPFVAKALMAIIIKIEEILHPCNTLSGDSDPCSNEDHCTLCTSSQCTYTSLTALGRVQEMLISPKNCF